MMPRFLTRWLDQRALTAWERDLEQRLAVRRAKRPARSDAAKRGWQSRRARA